MATLKKDVSFVLSKLQMILKALFVKSQLGIFTGKIKKGKPFKDLPLDRSIGIQIRSLSNHNIHKTSSFTLSGNAVLHNSECRKGQMR